MFCKKSVLRNFTKFTGKYLCQSLFFNKVAGLKFIKKETLAKVFSCEFCEISKNTFLQRTPLVAASIVCLFRNLLLYHAQTGSDLNENNQNYLVNFELGNAFSKFVTEIAKKLAVLDSLPTGKDVLNIDILVFRRNFTLM